MAMAAEQGAFFDLPPELVENEVVPRLELATAFAFALVNKRFYRILFQEGSLLSKHVNRIGKHQPLERVLRDCLAGGYDSLFAEVLPIASRILHGLSERSFNKIVREALKRKRFDLIDRLGEVGRRRVELLYPSLLEVAGVSGDLPLILDKFISRLEVNDEGPPPEPIRYLLKGVGKSGKMDVLEYFLAKHAEVLFVLESLFSFLEAFFDIICFFPRSFWRSKRKRYSQQTSHRVG